MGKTATSADLLTVCFQDLRDACRAILERVPGVAEHATSPALQANIAELLASAEFRRKRLETMPGADGGEPNIWIAGILDDAKRDTESIEAGDLLDAAMVGALRKAIAAEYVSHETAIALAEELGENRYLAALQECHAQLGGLNDAFAELLPEIVRQD